MCHLFTRGSHHKIISVILITQIHFHQGSYCRDISLNAHYKVALKNVRDKNLFMYLTHRMYPDDSIGFYNAYLDATQGPHGYHILHQTQNMKDGLRFRTNIFPTDYPSVIYPDIGDEACEIHLSRRSRAQGSRTEIV